MGLDEIKSNKIGIKRHENKSQTTRENGSSFGESIMADNNLSKEELETLKNKMLNLCSDNRPNFEKESIVKDPVSWLISDIIGIGVSKNEVYDAYNLDCYKVRVDDIKKSLKEVYGIEPTNENMRKILDGEVPKAKNQKLAEQYQKDSTNLGEGVADLSSGIASFLAYSKCLAPGRLLNKTAFGKIFGITALVGGLTKSTITLANDCISEYKKDSKITFNEHSSKYIKSFLQGAFSGILAPITGAIGGRVASKVASKAGLWVRDYATDDILQNNQLKGFKNMLLNPGGYKYENGTKLAIAGIYGLEMATDGILGGTIDCGFRTALDGGSLEDIKTASIQGGLCGAIFAPAIGGAFKSIGSEISRGFGLAETWINKISDKYIKNTLKNELKSHHRTSQEIETICNGFFEKEEKNQRGVYKCYNSEIPSERRIRFVKHLMRNKDYTAEDIAELSYRQYGLFEKEAYDFFKQMIKSGDFSAKEVKEIFTSIKYVRDDVLKLAKKLTFDKELKLTPEQISDVLKNLQNTDRNTTVISKAMKLLENPEKLEINVAHIPIIAKNVASQKQIRKLYKVLGQEKASKLTIKDVEILAPFTALYKCNNINEISISDKKSLLRALVGSNADLFELSETVRKDFPLIPQNQEEYCSLLPSLVRSMGIETKKLTPKERIIYFHQSTDKLSKTLRDISDEDFARLTIRQEYSREEFIQTVLEKVKHLSKQERQKVFDYFGFELHHNKANSTGYTIMGYPANLNNGKKLAQIDDEETRAVIENLRSDVKRFSEGNRIICENKEVEDLLNNLVEALPEMRTMIGRTQHGSHDYDVLKHSLKVFQKISQDPAFEKLGESDRKIMKLASMLHDITKVEGLSDKFHAKESSFDVFYIAKKFDLTKEEEIKLYKLIKHHEWLAYVNTAKTEEELTKRLQSVAYDLQQDNLFDLSLMFTHADLKGVKTTDLFHDKVEGRGRVAFKGKQRVFDKDGRGEVKSFGQSADLYAERIKGYVKELQKSQPLLPVTKMPKATRVRQAITHVHSDGSTNIKGVYINKEADGKELVVIKFNEVEDWEAIGLPKGSSTKGYKVAQYTDNRRRKFVDAETGNIKFFVHGLDYENQLAKFDAFSLVDSDVLLSVSYAERPETKYRFFRAQGVMLDVQTKYVHGGGNTDSGSGCGKFIDEFKKNYIFGGHREKDRLYVSQLIKKATGMSDSEYVQFVKANENKSMKEIRPREMRDKILKALATINSNIRHGNREYNEMYISNPEEVMGVFAYNENYEGKIGNPIKWLQRTVTESHESKTPQERTSFLRKYAIEHDIPFFVFGD